jgi:hypothetical protein
MDWRRRKLKCTKVRKNLSAFLDNELNTNDRKQVELHISECAECREEIGELKHTINLISRIERPEVPSYLWETTREKLTLPERIGFRIPKWSFIPVGAVAITFLMYILISQSFFIKQENAQIPVAIYIQEHKSVYSEQASLLDSWSEQTYTKMSLTTEKSESSVPSSELDIFMEAHYGGI